MLVNWSALGFGGAVKPICETGSICKGIIYVLVYIAEIDNMLIYVANLDKFIFLQCLRKKEFNEKINIRFRKSKYKTFSFDFMSIYESNQ